MAKILIVDDERSIRNTIKELLEMEGHSATPASDALEALDLIAKSNYDLIISDIKMPKMDGTELLSKIKTTGIETPVIMISGHGDITTAVDCIRGGAFDFIEKPIEMNRLLVSVRNALEREDLVQQNKVLKHKIKGNWEIIGQGEAIMKVKNIIAKVAPSDARVLITGSNGTGKELVARHLHLGSNRNSSPFIEVNCAAISSELIESELFGHEKGSFTSAIKQHKGKFEQASGGTIFLDEIGDMSLAAQAKVLRVLQERKLTRVGSDKDIEVDVRVLAATNKDLRHEIVSGFFREDLYHRLSVIVINVPPLAQRREDIPLLVNYFLNLLTSEMGMPERKIDPQAMDALMHMTWTGNIRELRNVVERLLILGSSPISWEDVNIYVAV